LNHKDHGDHREGRPEPIPPETNRVSEAVVDCAIAVHRELGPGLLESVFEACLTRELVAVDDGRRAEWSNVAVPPQFGVTEQP
jgi:hypothetical protein